MKKIDVAVRIAALENTLRTQKADLMSGLQSLKLDLKPKNMARWAGLQMVNKIRRILK